MPKVIHSSLREARTIDGDDNVSSLWIWNSGNNADTILTSDDDDTKWYNDVLSRSPSNRSRLSTDSAKLLLSRTPSSHSSSSRKVRLSLDGKKVLAFSQSPSPISRKLGVSIAPEAQMPSLLVSPAAAKKDKPSFRTQDFDDTNNMRKIPPASEDTNAKTSGYNSDDFGSVGEFSLPQEDIDKAKRGSWWNLKKPPLPLDEQEEDPTEREDSFSNSPAISLSKYVKRIGTSPNSSETFKQLQASDPDLQPRVVEVDEEDDMDSYDEIKDTAHQREADEDIEDTEHQREADEDIQDTEHLRESPQTVSVSEAAMRQEKIDAELNGMIEEMMQSDDFCEEDEMEPESYLAIMRAAKEICYTRKYYDVSADKIIYFPSIIKTIVNNDLFEKAEEFYFDGEDEFPIDYRMALRSVALDQMVAEEDAAGGENDELDDDTMHRLSIRVQRTETDFDELQQIIAAAEAEDKQETEQKLPSGAHSAVLKVVNEDELPDTSQKDYADKKPAKVTEAQDITMWWEDSPDTEQKYKQKERKSVIIGKKSQASEEEHVEDEADVQEPTVKSNDKPKRRSSWWDLNRDSESKYQIKASKSEKRMKASVSDQSDGQVDSEASHSDSEYGQSESLSKNRDDGDVLLPVAAVNGNGDEENDIMKWLRNGKSHSDGPNKTTSRIGLLLPTKNVQERSQVANHSDPILVEIINEGSASEFTEEYVRSDADEQMSEREKPPISETTNKEVIFEASEADHADSVDDMPQEKSVQSAEDALGYKVDQMMPKKRKRKKKDVSASTGEDHKTQQSDVINTDEAAVKAIPESMHDQETLGMMSDVDEQVLEVIETDHHDQHLVAMEAEDETIDDDSSGTTSFEVENVIVVSSHGEDSNYHDTGSAVSTLHASAYGDETDVAPIESMASLSSLMRSTEPGQVDSDRIAGVDLNTADGSAPSDDTILVSENSDGLSGTWSLGGTYENATKEEIAGLLKSVQKDIAVLIKKIDNGGSRTPDNSTAVSKSSTGSPFSLVLRPALEKSISGITLNSSSVPTAGGTKVKAAARKKRNSTENGWKRVAMQSPERSERTAKRSNKAEDVPLTNLSDVVEECMPEEDIITWTFKPPNEEGRTPPSPRPGKRKRRKGRRKSTGSHDEADEFYNFQLSIEESSDRGRSVSRSQSTSKIQSSKSLSSAGSSKGSQKRLSTKKRPKSISGDQMLSSSKPRRSASVGSGSIPRNASSSKRGRKKVSKDPRGFEPSNAGQSPSLPKSSSAKIRRASSVESPKDLSRTPTFSKIERSSSVPSLQDNPRQKSKKEKKSSKRLSIIPFARKSAGDIDTNKRREQMREKRESSLKELQRRMDQTVGILQSPTNPEGKKKRSPDLTAKAKEVEGLRSKLRMSFAKVIKSS
ncbi:MAG: hypothetical protein SGBAC_003665 [Bacillariaceae sp.]